MTSSTTNPIPKPGWGCFFFSAPLGFALLVVGAYALLFGIGSQGILAQGERVTLTYRTCPQAVPLLQDRVEFMGLGRPEWNVGEDQVTLTATLPANASATHIPHTIARTGYFAIRTGQGPTGDVLVDKSGVQTAAFSLKEMGNPLVIITLTRDARRTLETHMEQHVEDFIGVWIDEEPVLVRGNDPPFRREQVDVRAEGDDGVDNLRRAVDWAMLITHGPLPCPAELLSP